MEFEKPIFIPNSIPELSVEVDKMIRFIPYREGIIFPYIHEVLS